MKIKEEILLNQFGQGIDVESRLIQKFNKLSFEDKRNWLHILSHLIMQSKVVSEDVNYAIEESSLKKTYTPCVIAGKGIESVNLDKIVNLPESELVKAYRLFIYLFKIGYNRRYLVEKNDPNKWWYWDLSKEDNLDKIYKIFNINLE